MATATAVKTLASTPAAMSFSYRQRRRQELHHQYELLDKQQEDEEAAGRVHGKSFLKQSPFKLVASRRSSRSADQCGVKLHGLYPFSYSCHLYRMERARKRRAFLNSYNLSFEAQCSSSSSSCKGKVRRSMGQVKTALVTVLAFAKSNIFSMCRRSRPNSVLSPQPSISASRVAPAAA